MSEETEKYRFEYRHFRPLAKAVKYSPNALEYHCQRYMRGVVSWRPHERGGATLCFVYADGGEKPLAMGLSFCSMKDNFAYGLGRKIARGRALAALNGIEAKFFNGHVLSGTDKICDLQTERKVFFIPA